MSDRSSRLRQRIDPNDTWLWTWPIWTFGIAWLIVMVTLA